MMKILISSSLLVAALCGPALADDPAPARPGAKLPASPPCAPGAAAPAQPLDVTIVVSSAAQPRRYAMKLIVNESCGRVSTKTIGMNGNVAVQDQIEVCATSGAPLKLMVDWSTSEGAREFRNKSTVLPARGAKFDIEADGAKLTVSVK